MDGKFYVFAALAVALSGCSSEQPEDVPFSITIEGPPGRYLVKTQEGFSMDAAGQAQAFQAMVGSEGEVQAIRESLFLFQFDQNTDVVEKISELEASFEIQYVEPDYYVIAFEDPRVSEQWAHDMVDSLGAWSVTRGSHDVVVAVVDTGMDLQHPDLRDNLWENLAESPNNGIDDDGNGYVDDRYGWNFVRNNNNPTADDAPHYHGTHVSGTVGAVGGNGVGGSGQAQRVQLMPLKFLAANGSGTLSDAIRAIDYAIENGADIINNSWGSSQYSQALAEAVQRAVQADVLFVAAAGNGGFDGRGDDNDRVGSYPANYPGVFSVAATHRSDGLTSFSNYGATKVHVGAPGDDILSTMNGGNYGRLSGTSMAAPLVSGVAALMLAANPALSSEDLKSIMMSTVDRTLNGRVASGGRVNAARAVEMAASGADPGPGPNPDPDPVPDPVLGKAAMPLLNGNPYYQTFNAWETISLDVDVRGQDGAAGFYLEISRANRSFSNPNGTQPDFMNQYSRVVRWNTAGRFSVTPYWHLESWGFYEIRVIAFDQWGQALGRFSDSALLGVGF